MRLSKEKEILYLLAAVNFTHIMDVMIMMPLGDIFMDRFHINPTQFSILISCYSIAAFFSSLVGAVQLDQYGRKKALLFIYAGFVLGTIACGFAQNFVMLLCFRALTGLFGGMIGALALSIVSDLYPFKRRGKAMGALTASFSAAAALGVPFGLFLTDIISWRAAFFFLGAFGLILLVIIFFRVPFLRSHLKEVEENPGLKQVIRQIWGDMNQINALLLGFILVFGHYIIIPFITPYMTRNVGFEQHEITYMYFIGGVLTVFTAPLFGRMTDRIGAQKVFVALMLISFIPVWIITNMGPTPVILALVVTSLFFIFGSGRMIAPQTMITAAVGPANRGSFMSVKSAMQQLAIASSAFLGGIIIQFNNARQLVHYEWIGYLSIAISILAIFMSRKLKVAAGN